MTIRIRHELYPATKDLFTQLACARAILILLDTHDEGKLRSWN